MSLMTRLVRLFRADAHAVLDCIEEPALLLQQSLREMEDELQQEQHRYANLGAARDRLAAQQAAFLKTLQDCERDLEICLSADKDDLARTVLRQQLETAQWLEILANKLQANAVAQDASRRRIAEWTAQVADIRGKAGLFSECAASAAVIEPPGPGRVRDEEVEIALLAAKAGRSAP